LEDKKILQIFLRKFCEFGPCFIVIQVSLVISGRYVLSFWTANLEFADKKSIFDWKSVILGHFSNEISEFTDKKSANNEGRLYCLKIGFVLPIFLFCKTFPKQLRTLDKHFIDDFTDLKIAAKLVGLCSKTASGGLNNLAKFGFVAI
jgi:hypothetical protein